MVKLDYLCKFKKLFDIFRFIPGAYDQNYS